MKRWSADEVSSGGAYAPETEMQQACSLCAILTRLHSCQTHAFSHTAVGSVIMRKCERSKQKTREMLKNTESLSEPILTKLKPILTTFCFIFFNKLNFANFCKSIFPSRISLKMDLKHSGEILPYFLQIILQRVYI